MGLKQTQIECICRAAGCKPEDMPNLTQLAAGGNSRITDAGKQLINNRKREKDVKVVGRNAKEQGMENVKNMKGRLVCVSFGFFPGDDEQTTADEFDYLVIRCERGQVDQGYSICDAEVRLIPVDQTEKTKKLVASG